MVLTLSLALITSRFSEKKINFSFAPVFITNSKENARFDI